MKADFVVVVTGQNVPHEQIFKRVGLVFLEVFEKDFFFHPRINAS